MNLGNRDSRILDRTGWYCLAFIYSGLIHRVSNRRWRIIRVYFLGSLEIRRSLHHTMATHNDWGLLVQLCVSVA